MYKYMFLFILFFPKFLFSQTLLNKDTNLVEGKSIYMEQKVNNLIALHTAINKARAGAKGYRLQILSNSSREIAKSMRLRFILKFPEISAYIKYEEPYFKVTIGNFLTRLQALKTQDNIKKDFTSYVVPSTIELKINED